MAGTIDSHEGRKYLRTIRDARTDRTVQVDVYEVLEAFPQPDHASGHAIKKLLTGGQRGKGDRLADLIGARAALDRAIELERRRWGNPGGPAGTMTEGPAAVLACGRCGADLAAGGSPVVLSGDGLAICLCGARTLMAEPRPNEP